MEKTNKLNSKDLINIGIYTAMYLVVFFVVGMMNAVPILYPISLFFVPIVTGIPFMLFATKVKKSGMVFIMALILGLFWFALGYTWTPLVSYIVAGILAEIFFKVAKFQNFKLIVIGYCVFSWGAIGCCMPMLVMTDTYMAHIEEEMGSQYVTQLMQYMPWWMGIAGLGIIFIGGLIGAALGKKMLKKHFKRAGIA